MYKKMIDLKDTGINSSFQWPEVEQFEQQKKLNYCYPKNEINIHKSALT